jgi:hypothetical protein
MPDPPGAEREPEKGAATKKDASKRALRIVLALSPVGVLVAVLIYAGSQPRGPGSSFVSVLGVGLAAAAGAFFAGALLGFLFGLPKTAEQASGTGLARLLTNTNLDQVSDWITKIIVGLGLVSLGKAPHGISKLGTSLAPGLGNGPGAKAFAVSLVVYSAVDGFLIGYIWTRTDLSELFLVTAEKLNPTATARAVGLAEEIRPLPEVRASALAQPIIEPPDAPPDDTTP